MNNTVLLNCSAVKKQALALATELNKPELSRVSAEFVDRANDALHEWLKQQLASHPTDVKTIR